MKTPNKAPGGEEQQDPKEDEVNKKNEKGSRDESSNDEEPSSLRRVEVQTTDNNQINSQTETAQIPTITTTTTKSNGNSSNETITKPTPPSKASPKSNSNKVAESESEFLNRLKQPSAQQLTFKLKAFITTSRSQPKSILEQKKVVASFLESIYQDSLQSHVFADITDDVERENIRDGWEKIITIKLYDMVFGAPGTDEIKMTAHLKRKIASYSWIVERHFDLPFEFGAALHHAQREIMRVNTFRCPKDKIIILLNVIEIVVDTINQQNQQAGNDHLLPVLILVIIRANPPDLISNLKYKPELEKGAINFCMTTFMSAVSFIYNLSLTSLTLTEEEKEKYKFLTTSTARPSSASKAEPQKISTAASASNYSAPASPSNRLNTIASQFYRAFGDTAAAIKTAAVTVDGFTQGLFEKLNDSQSPLASNSSLPPKAPPLPQQVAQTSQTNDQNIPNDIIGIRRESTDRFSSARDRQAFETALTEAERGALEDYELQLAMALSLSTMEQAQNSSNVKTENTSSHKGSKVDEDDEIPLVRKKKNK